MVQFALLDKQLIRVQRGEGGSICIDVIDIETGRVYSRRAEEDLIDSEVVDALFISEESKHIMVSATDSGLTLTYTRVLPSGLALKPKQLEIEASHKKLSLIEMIGELCRANTTLHTDLVRVQKESELRSRYLEDMVQEKEQYQHSMLQRVSAIIDDRNARLTAPPEVKEELE